MATPQQPNIKAILVNQKNIRAQTLLLAVNDYINCSDQIIIIQEQEIIELKKNLAEKEVKK